MKKLNILKSATLLLLMCSLFFACSKDSVDQDKPTIDVISAEAYPKNCTELKRGETFTAKILVADNQELSSLTVDIHNNFDHHNHKPDDDLVECELAPVKNPVNPFKSIEKFTIPAGSKKYTATKEITIPKDVDTGDYHFMIAVTDKEGWTTTKGLSIKIK